MNRFAVIFLASLVILSNECNAIEEKAAEYSDPGVAIETDLGKDAVITLESNRTTGYEWQLARPVDEKVLGFVSSEYVAKKAETAMTGVGGKEIWTFKAVGKGKTEVVFKYVRPWEKDVPPAREAAFTVIVK